jgi:hypothetical protein
LDIFYQTPSNLYKLGKVKNQDGIALLPDTDSILAALEQQDATFKRHNDLSITDVPVPQAYPLAITTYALIYENYYYFEDGSDSDCKKIEYLVSFWVKTIYNVISVCNKKFHLLELDSGFSSRPIRC